MKKAYIIGSLQMQDAVKMLESVRQYSQAEVELNNKGITVVNITSLAMPEDEKQRTHLRITKLLSCNQCYLLPDWQNDKIAELEILAASFMGMEIIVANNALPPRKLTYIIN